MAKISTSEGNEDRENACGKYSKIKLLWRIDYLIMSPDEESLGKWTDLVKTRELG